MALYIIGGVRCELAPFNIDEADDESEMRHARHEVLGGTVSHEVTAQADRKLDLEGSIFPRQPQLDGRPELELLEGILADGSPILVTRGNTSLGWFVLTKLRKNHRYLDGSGVGRKVRVQISLERTQASRARSAAVDIFSRLTGYIA